MRTGAVCSHYVKAETVNTMSGTSVTCTPPTTETLANLSGTTPSACWPLTGRDRRDGRYCSWSYLGSYDTKAWSSELGQAVLVVLTMIAWKEEIFGIYYSYLTDTMDSYCAAWPELNKFENRY